MQFTKIHKYFAVLVVAVFLIQMVAVPLEAQAKYRDNSDQLPGMHDSPTISSGVIVAVGIAVVGVIYGLVKWNKKKKNLAEERAINEQNRSNVAPFVDFRKDGDGSQDSRKDKTVVMGLSVGF